MIILYRKYRELSISCQDIRHYYYDTSTIISNCGWHLSYFGDEYYIKNKIENFSHQELNLEHFTDVEKIKQRVSNFTDLYDREQPILKIPVNENPRLPIDYQLYLQKFILF